MKNKIVITGKFRTDKDSLDRIIQQRGLILVSKLDKDTSFLLIGDGSKSYWATSQTGKLIHKATRCNMSGCHIEIVFELEFIDQIKRSNYKPSVKIS